MTVEEKYRESYCELEELIQAGISLSTANSGVPVETRDLEVGSNIYTKLLAHARAIFILCPKSPAGKDSSPQELWDIASIAVLARTLIDTYYALYYVANDNPGKSENEFRWILWDYHAETRRKEKLELIGSKHPDLQGITKNINLFKKRLVNHPEYKNLKPSDQKNIRKSKEAILLSNSELSELAGIDKKFYKSAFMFLSSYVHSHPFSIQQLMDFKANNDDSLHLINVVIDYASLYLSVAIRDFMKVAPVAVVLPEETQRKIDIWAGIAKDFSAFKSA